MAQEKKRPAGLVFFEGQEKPRQYVIFNEATIHGQCPMEVFTTSGLQLTYSFLDPDQCVISKRDGKWYYRNTSENVFTFVGGRHVPCGREVELHDCTVIRLSNDNMLTAVFLTEFVSSTDWQIINMDDGRHDVRIDDNVDDGTAAITLQYDESRWYLKEINADRVLLNGKPVTSEIPIQFDDCIEIGETKFIFEGSGLVYGYQSQSRSLSINIDERSVHKALRKVTLLKDINLSIEPGNMVLILGGSGAGKSTFVNAVTGYEKANASIREGDIDYYRQYDRVKYRIGFVPQDNLMREDDTVGFTVSNAADMRLPATMSAEEKSMRVRAVLETFGLSGRENELVSKLSGGQKKRLSICMEFVSSPSLFILDEPDSGLDGIMATELMENLRLIACQGKIVIVITHAPDRVAHLFDKVIVLAKSTEEKVGQLAFYGGIQEARDFFGVPTMEDIVKQINAPNEGGAGRADEFIEKYRTYAEEREKRGARRIYRDADRQIMDGSDVPEAELREEVRAKDLRYKGRFEQIPVYLGKQFRLLFTEMNWKVLPMAAIIAYLVVYVIGKRMFRNMEFTKYGALAVICVCIWNGMFNSIQVVCKERSIIKREHRAGLHISSYLASHMIYQAVICLLQVVISIVIFKLGGVYFPKEGLVTGVFVFDLAISMFLTTFAADMLALMVSCIVHSTTTAMTVMPFLLIIQLVFAGSMFPLNKPMAKKISKLTISTWGINAVSTVGNYNGQKSSALYSAIDMMDGSDDEFLEKLMAVMQLPDVREKVETYTASKLQEPAYLFEPSNLLKCWGVLGGFSLIYALIGLVALEFVDKDKR